MVNDLCRSGTRPQKRRAAGGPLRSLYVRFGKRLFDVGLTAAAIPFALPLFGLLALTVRLVLGPPILFRQQRPGLRGRPFTLFKFRSMMQACDAQGNVLPDSERLTRFGLFLRATSLDELPSLWNVITGDMSLVGPRPLLMQYLHRYTADQARRLEIRPGITGWAQVRGRNAVTWEERFKLDVWYVDHMGFRLDLQILWLTIRSVSKRQGISAEGHVTMPEFTGSQDAQS